MPFGVDFLPPDLSKTLGSAMDSAKSAGTQSSPAARLGSWLSGVKFERGGAILPGGGLINMTAFADMVKRQAQTWGASAEDISSAMRGSGINFIQGADGRLVVTGKGGTQQAPPQTGGGMTVTPGGAYGGAAGGGFGSSGGSSGGAAGGGGGGVHSSGAAWGGGGGGSQSIPGFPGVPAGGGAAGMSWNDPLGFQNPGAGPGAIPGQGYQSGPFAYGKPRSIFDGLPANPTYGDVVGSTLRRQEENRDAALGIMSNARNEITNDPNRNALQGRVGDLLANPYSMDEATISRILGKTNEGITQRAAELRGNAADRAAAAGVGRSGSAQASMDAINNQAAGAMASGERDTRIQASIQNQNDLRSAMGAALPVVNEQTQSKNALDTTAARDILGTSSFTGDAFLSAAMNGKNQPGYVQPIYGPGYRLGNG